MGIPIAGKMVFISRWGPDSNCVMFVLQAELEQSSGAFEEADMKAATLAKHMSSMESQLADSQEMQQEETRQKLALQTRLRQAEEGNVTLQDQLEEEEEGRKAAEAKLATVTSQVGMRWGRKGRVMKLEGLVTVT